MQSKYHITIQIQVWKFGKSQKLGNQVLKFGRKFGNSKEIQKFVNSEEKSEI